MTAWLPNQLGNQYLNRAQADGLIADIKEARAALDKLEAAIKTEHPYRIADYVRDVERWMYFAHTFLRSAALDDEARRAKIERIKRNSVAA